MDLGVYVNGDTKGETISLANLHRVDTGEVASQISNFAVQAGSSIDGLDVVGLISKMITGVSECEGGCPENAKSLMRRGFPGFALEYIEGGILVARDTDKNGEFLTLKLFPSFD